MCIIIDTNVAARVLLCFDDPDFAPVTERLFGSRKPPVRLVYGGRLLTEYVKNDGIRRVMIELDRAGRAIRISDDKINEEERTLNGKEGNARCRSNDVHILALARAGNARILISHDQALHQDFKNRHIISNPRGKVFQRATHMTMLAAGCNFKPKAT